MTRRDEALINLFSHPDMVKDLLRGFVREDWVSQLDFRTLVKVETTFVSERLQKRTDDVIWRVRWGRGWLYIYILIEFQSRRDPWMALRMLTYVALLYQDLVKQRLVGRGERLPPVLPVVLYNGEEPWLGEVAVQDLVEPAPRGLERFVPRFCSFLLDEKRVPLERVEERNLAAALFGLEQSVTPDRLQAVVDRLVRFLRAPRQQPLRRAFAVWINRVLLPSRGEAGEVIDSEDLGEVQSMLEKTVKRWFKEWKAQGLAEGRAQGRAEGRAEGEAAARARAFQELRAEKLAIARRLLARGLPVAEVAELTGITPEEIEPLRVSPRSVKEPPASYKAIPRKKPHPRSPRSR